MIEELEKCITEKDVHAMLAVIMRERERGYLLGFDDGVRTNIISWLPRAKGLV